MGVGTSATNFDSGAAKRSSEEDEEQQLQEYYGDAVRTGHTSEFASVVPHQEHDGNNGTCYDDHHNIIQETFTDHPSSSSSQLVLSSSLIADEVTLEEQKEEEVVVTTATASLPQKQQTYNPRYPPNAILHVSEFNEKVFSIAHSIDGNYLASSGGRNNTLVIKDTSNNEVIKQQSFDNMIRAISFSTDNKVLVVGGSDGNVSIFDAKTHELINDPVKMENCVLTLSFSKSSKWLFVGGWEYFCILKRSKKDGKYKIHEEHKYAYGYVHASSFTCTNDDVIAFSIDSVVWRYNIKTDTRLQVYQQNDKVQAIQFSPCDQYMFIGGEEKKFRVYHVLTSSMTREHQHDGSINSICYSKATDSIIVGEDNEKVTFYDISTICKIHEFKTNGYALSISSQASKPTNIAIASGHTVFKYDAGIFRQNTIRKRILGFAHNAVAYCSSGKELVYGGDESVYGGDSKILFVVDTESNEVKREIAIDESIYALEYSSDGAILLCGTYHGMFYAFDTATYEKEELEVKNIKKVDLDWTYNTFNFFNDCVAILGESGKYLNLYNMTNNKFQETHLFEFEEIDRIDAIDFCKSENVFAIGTEDGISVYSSLPQRIDGNVNREGIRTINNTSMTRIEDAFTLLKKHYIVEGIDLIHYSPKGKLIAYGKRGSKHVYISRSDTNIIIGKIEARDAKDIISLQFSPDGKVLAIGSRNGILELIRVEDCRGKDEENDTDVLVLPWEQFCMSLYFSTCEMIKYITFYPSQVPGSKCTTESDQGNGTTTFECDETFYYLVIRYKEYYEVLKEVVIHNGSKCPVECLLRRYDCVREDDQDKIIELICDPNNNCHSAFTRDQNGTKLSELALEKGILGKLLCSEGFSSEPFLTCTNMGYVDNTKNRKVIEYNQRLLKKLVTKYLLDDLSIIAKFGLQATTPMNILQDLYYTLQDLVRKEETETATKFLNAEIHPGEKYKGIDCPAGFIIVDDFHANIPNSDGNGLSLLKRLMKSFAVASTGMNKFSESLSDVLVPVVEKQKARSSDNPFDLRHTCWKDLKEDEKQRVHLYILRVYVPDLGSFESLKTLNSMKNPKLFESRVLHAVLDAIWTNFAQTWFYIQFGIYCLLLVSFTSFCEITKYHVYQMNILHRLDLQHDGFATSTATSFPIIVYILCGIVSLASVWLMYVELRQIQHLGLIHYCSKYWNLTQWFSIALVAATMNLRLTTSINSVVSDNENDTTEQWISVVSALALLLSWFGLFSYLRGFEDFAWIIMALQRITVSFRYFLMVVLLVIISFAMSFRALYKVGDEDIFAVHSNDPGGNDNELLAYMNIAAPFANIPTALLRTFMAGILGDIDTDEFWKTHSIIITIVFLFLMLFFVLIIAMNALIAFISERFEVVLDEKNAVLKSQKAAMILDVLCLFSKTWRRKMEIANRWTSLVVPAASLSAEKPLLENHSRATKEDTNQIKRDLKKLQNIVEQKTLETKDLENEVKEIKIELKETKIELKEIQKCLKVMTDILVQLQGKSSLGEIR